MSGRACFCSLGPGRLDPMGITSHSPVPGLSTLDPMRTDGLPGSSLKQSNSDRRREARIPVTLNALARFRSGKSWVCTIRDFCSAGMLLQGGASALRLALGDSDDMGPLEIRFAVPGDGTAPAQHHITGTPVRRMDDALGLHFPKGMSDVILRSLIAFSQRDLVDSEASFSGFPPTGRSNSSIDEAQARKLATACVKPAALAIGKLTDEFFSLFIDELNGCEKRASSMAERDQYLFALKVIPDEAPRVRMQLVRGVTDPFKNFTTLRLLNTERTIAVPDAEIAAEKKGPRLFDKAQFALVEKADFEQWLVVAEAVSAIERQLEEEIFILKTWLGLLVPSWKNKDCNPVFPAAIAQMLKQALMPLDFREEVIRVAFTSFGRIAQSRLGAFYDKLIRSLEKTGMFPSARSLVAPKNPVRTSTTPHDPSQTGHSAAGPASPSIPARNEPSTVPVKGASSLVSTKPLGPTDAAPPGVAELV